MNTLIKRNLLSFFKIKLGSISNIITMGLLSGLVGELIARFLIGKELSSDGLKIVIVSILLLSFLKLPKLMKMIDKNSFLNKDSLKDRRLAYARGCILVVEKTLQSLINL